MSPFKILIVEDDAIESLDLRRRLESLGYEVPYVASRGHEAIDKTKEIMPDLVLMDISLKGDMDGIDAAEEIIKYNIPIIYLTAHSDEATVKKAKHTQPYGYLIKPYDPNELKYALELAIYKSKNDKKLKDSERVSNAILDSSNDSLFLVDTDGIVMAANNTVANYFGLTKEKMVGTELKNIVDQKFMDCRSNYFKTSIKTKQSVEFEGEYEGAYFHHRINPIIEDGKVTKLAVFSQNITDKKIAAQKIIDSEKKYRTIFDHAGSATLLFDSDGKILMVNSEWQKVSGYSQREVEGKMKWMEFVHPDYIDLMIDYHQKRVKGDVSVPSKYESCFIKKNGDLLHMYVSVVSIPGTKEWLASAIDITELKKTQSKLLSSEERLKVALQSANAAIFDWNIATGKVYFSPEYYKMFGYAVNEFFPNYNSWVNLIHPEDREKISQKLNKQIKEKVKNFEIEYRVICKDKTIKWILGVAKGVEFDENNVATRIIGMNLDISERKKMEDEIWRSKNYLDKIINSIPDPVFVKDKNHRWILINDAFCEFIGHSKEDLLHKSDYDFFPHHEADIFWEKDEEVFESGQENINEEQITTVNKDKRTIITKKILYTDKSGEKYLVGVIRDVTDLKNVEKTLKEQYNFLQYLMDSIPSPVFYKDTDYKYQGCNKAFEDKLGVYKEEIIGKTVYDINPLDLANKFHEKDRELFDNPGTQIYEAPVKYGDGTIHDILFTKNTFNDPEGNLAGMIGVMSDITRLKDIEKSLKISEQEYKGIFENINTAVAVYDAVENGKNFIFKDFNQAGARIENLNREDVIGEKITEVFPGAEKFGILEVLQRVWRTGTPEKFPTSFYEDERISGWRENYIYKLPSGELVAVYDDLTKQKQTEEELKLNENRLKILVKILQYTPKSVQNLLDYALEKAIELTGSKIGHIYHYNPYKKQFVLKSCSKSIMEECSISESNNSYELEKTGVLSETVLKGTPLILNDFKKSYIPKKGYRRINTPIYKYMTLPVFSKGEVVAVVGVANKENDYTKTDLLQLELLIDAVWKVVGRQKAEEALKVSETTYRAIFENTGTAMAISEDNMVLSLVNEEFTKLTGYSKDNIENKMCWTEFFRKDQLERMKKYHKLRRIDPTKVPKNYESRVKTRNGDIIDVYMSVAMIPGTKNSLVSVLNITDKKQSRIKLRRELKITQALARIYSPIISPDSTIEDVAFAILKESKQLTDSDQGFVSSIDPQTKYNIAHTLTPMMANCKVMINGERGSFTENVQGKYEGLWGHCLNTGKSFFTNTPQTHESSHGTPEGHVKLRRFLSVPVFLREKLVGQIALANSNRDYIQNDIKSIERIAEFYALAIQNKNTEKEIKKSLEEKETLLREIHHRVKNNMQIISSLLNLQKYWDSKRNTLEMIEDSQNRIKTMSIVHELLYQSDQLSKVNLKTYIEKLSNYLFEQYSARPRKILLITDLDEIYVNIETAVPCCLIVNELVSNSLKHAFSEGSVDGEIRISLHELNGKYELIVQDNGIGFPKQIDLEKKPTLGLYLVTSLVDQIDGNMEIKSENRALFKITFKELVYSQRV
ncbi:PAS domain S-box protein [Methanobacterium alcaliphilum]|nr:PAS domain S-box protein [Methanobacterium alcaliphilum]